MKKLKIALDWTPNVNHIGIFVAKELKFYQEQNLDLEIINPLEDDYKTTPGKKLELDLADFAIAPFETVISLNNKKDIINAIAVFAILQEDISSIASLKSSNLDRPKYLDGKLYASYKARYEDQIVKEMIKNDGGTGEINIVYPDKLGIWHILLENKADATWIFNNWEGIEADGKQIELNKFSLDTFGIPYGYSPVIITKKENISKYKTDYAAFVKATKQGYLYSSKNKAEAVKILTKYLTESDKKNIDIHQSINFTTPYFGDEEVCGTMKPERVQIFLAWLVRTQLEDKKIMEQVLFTNDLLG